ncbi:MAG TPA: crotonase/enoyl-CoA hydratase family protein [Burkholderiales bacterium]|nr:crotonase/enoyl-CoA hydratase family protein [Burkholderiales bacterium]
MDMNLHPALLKASSKQALYGTTERPEYFFSEQLSAYYDKASHAVWCRWTPTPRPSFNPDLLQDLSGYCRFITDTGGTIDCLGEESPVEYTVLSSGVPGVFNLGGDLDLFSQLIEQHDAEALLRYGKACIDVLYRNYIGHGLPITTISLVQGECLGGGFEAALSSDIVIAERHARFGFPEILFNLFPGMGAYSFLDRRVGKKTTEELLLSGKIYSADDMLSMGVIDCVVDSGRGEEEVHALVKRQTRCRNGIQAIAATRRRVRGISKDELIDVVTLWVEAAMRLTTRDMKLMQRLVSRQNELRGAVQVH